MIKQECIGIPDMILLLMNFFVSKKIKIRAEIVLSPGGAYFQSLEIAIAKFGFIFCDHLAVQILDNDVSQTSDVEM